MATFWKKKWPNKPVLLLADFAHFSSFFNILRKHLTLRGSGGQTTWPTGTHRVSLERSYSDLSFDTYYYLVLLLVWSQIAQEKSDPCDTTPKAHFCPCKNEGVYAREHCSWYGGLGLCGVGGGGGGRVGKLSLYEWGFLYNPIQKQKPHTMCCTFSPWLFGWQVVFRSREEKWSN